MSKRKKLMFGWVNWFYCDWKLTVMHCVLICQMATSGGEAPHIGTMKLREFWLKLQWQIFTNIILEYWKSYKRKWPSTAGMTFSGTDIIIRYEENLIHTSYSSHLNWDLNRASFWSVRSLWMSGIRSFVIAKWRIQDCANYYVQTRNRLT